MGWKHDGRMAAHYARKSETTRAHAEARRIAEARRARRHLRAVGDDDLTRSWGKSPAALDKFTSPSGTFTGLERDRQARQVAAGPSTNTCIGGTCRD